MVGCILSGDEEGALRLLDPEVVLVSDGGPARGAARYPVVGAARVHRLLNSWWRPFGCRQRPGWDDDLPAIRLETVNSTGSLVFEAPGGPVVVSAEAVEGRIVNLWARLDPDKTERLGERVELS